MDLPDFPGTRRAKKLSGVATMSPPALLLPTTEARRALRHFLEHLAREVKGGAG